ncbi:MAG: PspA/IM30 family protein [Cyanobacteria bacterium J06641_5]
MKKAIYWLMGEEGGRATLAIWRWLWGLPVTPEPEPEPEPQKVLEVAEASLQTMQASVKQLAQATNQQYEGYRQAKRKYLQRVRELEQLERMAALAQQEGRKDDARIAVARAMHLEEFLPQLEEQVKRAEQFMQESQAMLRQERSRLEAYRNDLQDLKDLTEINEALAAIAQVHDRQDIESTRIQFEQAKASVHERYLERQAYAELLANSAGSGKTNSDQLTQEAEISRRLQHLKERE